VKILPISKWEKAEFLEEDNQNIVHMVSITV
jgi:hypothetical protein